MVGSFVALNGLASVLVCFIMIGVMAVVGGSDLITGFKSALAFMGGLSIVSGILVAILMPKDAAYGVSDEEKENQKKITFKDYVSAFKIPGVWIMAILVWCYVTISAVASYLTPYSTGVLGMSAALAATIGTFRTYGCRLIGGPLGGYLADKAFKSVSKEQLLGQLACLVTIGIFLVLPGGTRGGLLGVLLQLVGMARFLCEGGCSSYSLSVRWCWACSLLSGPSRRRKRLQSGMRPLPTRRNIPRKIQGGISMSKIKINTARCKGCGYCVNDCPRKALSFSGNINDKGYDTVQVDDALCVACGTCYRVCPDSVFEILE